MTTSTVKRGLADVSNVAAPAKDAKKTKSSAAGLSSDVDRIKSIIGDIQDPSIKSALENIIKNKGKVTSTVVSAPKKDAATLEKLTNSTIRTVQKLINEKLKWKASYKRMDGTKGGRVEVVCQDAEIFERIFDGAPIKKSKDGSKLTVSIKTEGDMGDWECPFDGKSYRYNRSYLSAPYTASLKDGNLTFGYKFGIC